jgi:hypothetical protein
LEFTIPVRTMLGFGLAEIISIAVVILVMVGAAKAPDNGSGSRYLRKRRQTHTSSAWTRSDWILVAVVAALGVLVVGLYQGPRW